MSGEGVNEWVSEVLGGSWGLCMVVKFIGRRGREKRQGGGVLWRGRELRWLGRGDGKRPI